VIATFALGSDKLYRLMDRNPALEIDPVNFTNDPSLAGLNDNLAAINAPSSPPTLSKGHGGALGEGVRPKGLSTFQCDPPPPAAPGFGRDNQTTPINTKNSSADR
jgi:hypothetical protein